MAEEWRPAKGYEGLYSVSSEGRVRSENRTVLTKAGPRRYRGRLLKTSLHSDRKHRVVTLSGRDTKRKIWLVHRIVLLSFENPPSSKSQALHRNDNAEDNRLDNLYWGDSSDNMNDRVRNKIHHNTRKTRCNRGHEFNSENTRINKYGNRQCIACQIRFKDNYRKARGASV